jgi:uncharacterized protein
MSKVLLVDSDKLLHDSVPTLFKGESVSFDHSSGLGDVFQKLSLTDYDLIISNYRLGSMTGLDLLKVSKISHPETEMILLLNPQENRQVVKDAMRAGASNCILKPYEDQSLITHIRRLLRLKDETSNNQHLENLYAQADSPAKSPQEENKSFENLLGDLEEFEAFISGKPVKKEKSKPPASTQEKAIDSAGSKPAPASTSGVYPRKRPRNTPFLYFELAQESTQALMICYPRTNKDFEYEEAHLLLKRGGVTHGVDCNKIETLLKKVNRNQEPILGEVVAVSAAPIHGEDETLVIQGAYQLPFGPLKCLDSQVVYAPPPHQKLAAKGEIVAIRTPRTQPHDGTLVTGKSSKGREGRSLRCSAGKNCSEVKDKQYFISEIDEGQVLLKAGRVLEVHKVRILEGGINEATGDIQFDGTLIVNGMVTANRKVVTEGDLIVKGMIDGAQIISEGNIHVQGGIQGGKDSQVESKGSVTAKFCANANIIASGNILVNTSILHSQIQCEGKVTVLSGKGIVGGETLAVEGIETTSVGSSLGVATEIVLGHQRKTEQELKRILDQKTQNLTNIQKVAKVLSSYRDIPLDRLPKATLDQVVKLKLVLESLRNRELEFNKRMYLLKERLDSKSQAKLMAHQTVYPDVQILIGRSQIKGIHDPIHKSVFREDPEGSRIQISPIMRFEDRKNQGPESWQLI